MRPTTDPADGGSTAVEPPERLPVGTWGVYPSHLASSLRTCQEDQMTLTLESDSSPRLLPVTRRVRRRGKDLERFLNLWRLALLGSLALTILVGRIGGAARPEDALALAVLGVFLLGGLALQLYLAWVPWDPRVSLWVSGFDFIAVTAYLLGCVVANRAIVATNSQPFFFYYFFIVIAAGLRGDPLVSRVVTWSVPAAYAFVVFMAVAWRHVEMTARPDPVFGGFTWELQVTRVIILAVVTVIVNYDVGLAASDRAEARTDPLTGAYNRRFLEEFLNREMARSRRAHHPLSVLMVDLDGFKVFNDRYGHLEGDRMLAAVAAALRGAVRTTDIVARYGGDEFLVVLPNTPGEAARRVARELTRAVPPPVTLSVGIGCMGVGVQSPAQLFAIADAALMRAKQSGGGVSVE
ncbi:MAG: GGDEF domain-containing protein [Acidobacteria bacterium]|nr:MAG: GGDEF domain-containing protein [Acidobacteriota bacterium]